MAPNPSPREVARYLGQLAHFAWSRAERDAADRSVLRDLARAPLDLPAGLGLEWLGVAGYRLTYEGQTVYLDPYLSRVPLAAVLRRRRVVVDPALYEQRLDPHAATVVGVLVGHTHFDHAVDVPAIAARYGANAYGSRSLVQLMRLHGEAERAVEVVPREPFELGPFTVTFFPSAHSKLILGYAVPSDGELTCEHLDGLTPSAYRCGAVYGIKIEVAGFALYHQGSANLIDDEVPAGGVDLFLAGVAGRTFTPDYWSRILPRLDPQVVVASHFDDFFRPVGGDPGLSLNVGMARLPDEIGAVSSAFRVAALTPFSPVVG